MRKLMLAAGFAASAMSMMISPHAASATVVTYDGTNGNSNFNVSYSSPALTDTSLSTGDLSLGAASYLNNGNNGATGYQANPGGVSDTRYYGGTITYVQGTAGGYSTGSGAYQAPTVSLEFKNNGVAENPANPGQPGALSFDVPSTDPSYWKFYGYSYPQHLTGSNAEANAGAMALPGNLTSSFDFVIKISDSNYGPVTVAIFLGANADAAVEGTPDYQNHADSPINFIYAANELNISLISYFYTPQGSSLTTSNMFGANVWTPVGAVVPEPTSVAFAMIAGAGLMMRRVKSAKRMGRAPAKKALFTAGN